jgi:peroxiredoxin
VSNTPQGSYLDMPDNLPIPQDDGAADHLVGTKIASVMLKATDGSQVDLSKLSGTSVVFIYPMTGVPGVALPDGWDDIPGARGCTPQACSYRDNYSELKKHVDNLFGLSVQSSEYQKELKDRVELPYEILSDSDFKFANSLKLPTFEANSMKLLKRLTMIIKDGVIINKHYPVFPSNKDVNWVLNSFSA